MPYTPQQLEDLRARLVEDTVLWAEHCAHILDRRTQQLVKLRPNDPQLKLERALEAQRAAGKPMRAIVLKARKLGFSTWVQAKIMHRITLRPNRRALVVAQDTKTAGVLFEMGERMWEHLPPAPEIALKPTRVNRRQGRMMHFGQPARLRRDEGDVGLNSRLEIDTANEVASGRGLTITELHLSEVAHWPNPEQKMLALVNAVAKVPETVIVLESTANGMNFFQERWEAAEKGESEYAPVFAAWHEDPDYQASFDTPGDRDLFLEQIGQGPWGEDEPELVERFGCTPEQLLWRRRQIVDELNSDLVKFKQEYPATAGEAFTVSGKQRFSIALVSRVIEQTKQTDPDFMSPDNPGPEIGMFVPGRHVKRRVRSGVLDVPADPRWTVGAKPTRRVGEGKWRLWGLPDPGRKEGEQGDGPVRPKGRYVVSADPAEGELTTRGESAYSAIQVIDHRTKVQMAEYRSREDWDVLTDQVYMAALFFNMAIVVPEKTGGYGTSMILRLWRDYRYPNMHRQRVLDRKKDTKFEDRLGWDTNRATKPLVEDGLATLLRENPEVFRSFLLASELQTYIRDERGKTGPADGKFADLLMAFGNGQQVAVEAPIPSERGATSTSTRPMLNPVTGY